MEKIKVILSDHQILFREGIHFVLSGEEDFEVTGEAVDNEEAFTLIESNPPDIAILSTENERFNGPEITGRIKRNLPSVSVILTAGKVDDEILFSAMKTGASACLPKDIKPEYLLETTKIVAKGNRPIVEALLTPALASKVLAEFDNFATLNEQLDNMLANLAAEESHILDSIAEGSKIDQVAAKLNITEEAIRRNLREIVNKLVANERALTLIEATKRSLPSIVRIMVKEREASEEFVTKQEFNKFKESLLESIKSFISKGA